MSRQDAILAVGLQQNLIQEELQLCATDNGSGAYALPDYEVALHLESARLEKLRQELVDRDVAQNLANGILREHQSQIQTDRVALLAMVSQDRQAVNDHEAARELAGMAAVTASTGDARRSVDQAICAINQFPHLTQPTTIPRLVQPDQQAAAKTPTHTSAPDPVQLKSTPHLESSVDDDSKVEAPKTSAGMPIATVSCSGKPEVTTTVNNAQPQVNAGNRAAGMSAVSKRKLEDSFDAAQSPAAKRIRREDISTETQMITPLEAGVGTGGRVFNGTLVQVDAAQHSDEDCRYHNLQTITSLDILEQWSLEELRLQDYYHGYRYNKPAGVPQSSNKRSFSGFMGDRIGGSSESAVTKRKLDNGASVELTECIICLKNKVKHESITTECGHTYCRGCITRLFQRSLSNPELFPPRCCKIAIAYDQVHLLFPGEFRQRFDERLEEFETADPIYCPTVDCGKFLPPRIYQQETNTAACDECKEIACTKCRRKAHEEDVCPGDKDLEELRKIGKDFNWQVCYKCKNMVELRIGCYHISCRCGAQFCYLCGVPWTENPKACKCVRFDESHLLTRAREVAQREATNGQATQAQNEAWVDRLRENPDCRHTGWEYVFLKAGDNVVCDIGCGDLNDKGFHFIMECSDCLAEGGLGRVENL
ncbi:hypothetical protein FKW77_003476 [Venturia effusa]|uniref:RBR-type E3 ubiquitin transferase n=1 Tax=Venturia effusa TaxID=50376 RepID=A0A517LQY9_9PEZI|nr:hypothetical protein FKW77_003476 [Venturia effusa]